MLAGAWSCRWRTKRDFLLLSRAIKRSVALGSDLCGGGADRRSSCREGGEFPKAIYTKLAERAASTPWIRPDLEGVLDDDYFIKDTGIDCDRNGWMREMYKSVRRLDYFLVHAMALHKRFHNASGLEPQVVPIVGAWTEFCRPGDCENLVRHEKRCREIQNRPLENEKGGPHQLPSDPTLRAAYLGQYFASDENASSVADAALRLAVSANCNGSEVDLRRVVFVEPSCGDGRVLQHLLEVCAAKEDRKTFPYCVLGYDLDGAAVEACQKRIALQSGSESLMPWAVRQANFLTLTKETLVQNAIDARRKHGDETSHGTSASTSSLRFIFFGGPPYSFGQGRNSQERGLDLPHNFIRHCILGLKGDSASFLLPERCEKGTNRLKDELGREWSFATNPIRESRFDFRGKTVFQPSVLQCWFRTSSS